MEILEIILFILSYTVGVIVVFLELICYQRRIEYIETIWFTISFLLLVVAVSITRVFEFASGASSDQPNVFILLATISVSLTTPLNVFAERNLQVSELLKKTLYIFSGVLLVLLFAGMLLNFLSIAASVISAVLGISVISSMILLRNTKPGIRIKHREKTERIIAIICLIVLPLTLSIEFFSDQIEALSFIDDQIQLTLPLLFLLLATSKLLDDLNRLSLFKPENTIKEQNMANYSLTPRELEIADLLIKGTSYHQISEQLFISMPTVKTHVTNIYRKVQVNNKIELVNQLTN